MDAELAGEAPSDANFNYAYPEDDGGYEGLGRGQGQGQGQGGYDYGNAATSDQPLLGYDVEGSGDNGYNDWQTSGQEGGEAGAAEGSGLGYWETAYDEEGTPYYYNSVTGISTYDNPHTPLDPEVGVGVDWWIYIPSYL